MSMNYDAQFRLSDSGGKVTISLGLLIYITVVSSLLRFFQSLYKIDQRMRILSGSLYEQPPHTT